MITILGELYSSKNSKRILKTRDGRYFIGKSAISKGSEKGIEQQLIIYHKKWESLCTGKKYPLKVVFKIYRKTKRIFDYVNIVQCLLDCMTKCGYFPDDNADYLIPVFEPYEVDKNNPRVEITIK